MIYGFITATVVLFIIELNSVNLLKQRVSQTLNNITITNKRSDNLLDKANKVTEKYMAFEQRINEFLELKSNQSIMELLKQLRESENIVANFKLEHNAFVAQYNYNIIYQLF